MRSTGGHVAFGFLVAGSAALFGCRSTTFVSWVKVAVGDEVCGISDTGFVECAYHSLPAGERSCEPAVGDTLGDDCVYRGPRHVQLDLHRGSRCKLNEERQLHCYFDSYLEFPEFELEYTDVSVGAEHVCTMDVEHGARCWCGVDPYPGPYDYGIHGTYHCTESTLELSTVEAGSYTSCGLAEAQSLHCWGEDTFKSSGPFVAVTAGSPHICALDLDGRVHCWVHGGLDFVTPPRTDPYTQVTAGLGHVCALTRAGRVDCWGEDDHGQSTPPPGRFTNLSCGTQRTCGVTLDGDIECWGSTGEDPLAESWVWE